ncbi:glycerate kinase [Bacillus sp. SG-1]|uniref:glycerate kinase n=1 Tax=Bacillus sp. SG-1 TaxID=161544 RepID=UPI0001543D06|nr:glycerate kinase [Bacillus sp. SG-1]EDL65614.1 Glycerate kinase [Bacillus sp. SG-1]
MKIIIAPDSFKGSLTALQAGTIIQTAFLTVLPNAKVDVVPMADGGEGTLDTLLFATKGKRFQAKVMGPLGKEAEVEYGLLGDEETVIIEMAQVSGLPMVPEEKRNPLHTTSYGIGEVIEEAIQKGYRKFIIGLGGSATNDGGLGMLQALGVTFLDGEGKGVDPIGASVEIIERVDFSTIDRRVKDCTFQIASDVENPLCGENGATAVFGPQKGADAEMVKRLDAALSKYASLIEKHLDMEFMNHKGAGAAGGLGFAFLAIGGEMISGSKLIAEAAGLQVKLENADFVITGEGQSDFQTLFGKVPGYVGKLAAEMNVNALLISGGLGKGYEELYQYFISCNSIVSGPMPLQQCMDNAESLLFNKAVDVARNIQFLYKRGK